MGPPSSKEGIDMNILFLLISSTLTLRTAVVMAFKVNGSLETRFRIYSYLLEYH